MSSSEMQISIKKK